MEISAKQTRQFIPHKGIVPIDLCGEHNCDSGPKGYVSLVGAGPNDPDLLTVKAHKLISSADVVVYDRLVSQAIVDLSGAHARLIYVGKRCGQPSIAQEEISQILVDLAKQGKNVVRLKGGDPFIFGRGGEEALLLAKSGIPYQVVPGITAAIGCAASSLIPLTHRQVSRSVTFVTGQVVTGALPAWSELVGSGQTLVFYMGLEKAVEIQNGLISNGLSGDFPLAIVTHGCSPEQKVYVSRLEELEKQAKALKGVSPALIILGEVVKLREELKQTLTSVISHEVV
jgi:uroporphyrin-III C-methyltransferase